MYEITFITKDEKNSLVKDVLKNLSAKILSEEFLGRKKFAYKIAKENAGYYSTIVFEVDPQNIEKLIKKIQHEQEIIRYLIIKKDKIIPKQKIIAPEKEKRALEKIIKKTIPEFVEVKKEEKITKEKKAPKTKPSKKFKVETPTIPKIKVEKEKKEISDEERLKKLDEKLSELLKE